LSRNGAEPLRLAFIQLMHEEHAHRAANGDDSLLELRHPGRPAAASRSLAGP
jgi:hypothetical protein